MGPAIDILASSIATKRTGKAPLWLYQVTDKRRTRRTNVAAHSTNGAKREGARILGLEAGEVLTQRVRLFGSES